MAKLITSDKITRPWPINLKKAKHIQNIIQYKYSKQEMENKKNFCTNF